MRMTAPFAALFAVTQAQESNQRWFGFGGASPVTILECEANEADRLEVDAEWIDDAAWTIGTVLQEDLTESDSDLIEYKTELEMTSGTKTFKILHRLVQRNATTYEHNFFSGESDSGIEDSCDGGDEYAECDPIYGAGANFRPVYRLNKAARRYAVNSEDAYMTPDIDLLEAECFYDYQLYDPTRLEPGTEYWDGYQDVLIKSSISDDQVFTHNIVYNMTDVCL